MKQKQIESGKTYHKALRTAALGLMLATSAGLGCSNEGGGISSSLKKESKTPITKSEKKNGNGLPKECDIELTREEIRQVEAGFAKKCNTDEAEMLFEGNVVSTQTGKQAKVFRIDGHGAFIAFGANGSYSAGAYIPYGTTMNIFDPSLRDGKENEKVRELNEDVWMLVCPSKNQPAAKLGMTTMRVVKKTWGQLKCLIADLRKAPEEREQKKVEAQKKLEELRSLEQRLIEQKEELKKILKSLDPKAVPTSRPAKPAA
jgi:hypothetical protein